MSTNTKNNTTPSSPVFFWGTAVATHDKDNCARDFVAVRYEMGKSGYTTEGDVVKGSAVSRCPSRSYAIVRAVNAAREFGDGVNRKTAEAYPTALAMVLKDKAEKAAAALRRAEEAAAAAEQAAAAAEQAAAATIAAVKVIG